MPASRPQPHRALSHLLVAELSADIRNDVLRPGDKLPIEPELAQRFGVSRTVVRESVQRLQAMGMVEVRRGVGTFVLAPTADHGLLLHAEGLSGARQVLAMLELRIGVETEAAALAAMRRTDAQLAGMRRALLDFDTALREGRSTLSADFDFHRLIAQATHNPYFEQVLHNLGHATMSGGTQRRDEPHAVAGQAATSPTQFGAEVATLLPGKAMTAHEHEGLFERIAQRDVMGARAAMLVHLSSSRERMRRASATPA